MAVKDEQGFFSIELIICSIIMCLSITVALPKLVNTDKLELEYEAIHMINDIRYIQSISEAKNIKNNFSQLGSPSKPYIIIQGEGYKIYYTNADNEIKCIKYIFPKNVSTVTYGKKKYYFSKDSVNNAITITLQKNEYIINIIIDVEGRVRLEKK